MMDADASANRDSQPPYLEPYEPGHNSTELSESPQGELSTNFLTTGPVPESSLSAPGRNEPCWGESQSSSIKIPHSEPSGPLNEPISNSTMESYGAAEGKVVMHNSSPDVDKSLSHRPIPNPSAEYSTSGSSLEGSYAAVIIDEGRERLAAGCQATYKSWGVRLDRRKMGRIIVDHTHWKTIKSKEVIVLSKKRHNYSQVTVHIEILPCGFGEDCNSHNATLRISISPLIKQLLDNYSFKIFIEATVYGEVDILRKSVADFHIIDSLQKHSRYETFLKHYEDIVERREAYFELKIETKIEWIALYSMQETDNFTEIFFSEQT